jgi:membrane protein DedA with SNARE-associated domain
MPKWIEEGIDRYGAVAIFVAFIVSGVGLHLSEDLILIPAGWLAANDWRMFAEFAFAAYLGIVLGDAGWFWMCRTFGTRVMHTKVFKRLFHPRRLLEIKWQIDQRGAWVLLAARFIPGTRTPVITMCGVLHMAWWKLLLVEGTCVLITAPLQMMIGWLAFHAAAKAGVTKHITAAGDYAGFPAQPVRLWRREMAAMRAVALERLVLQRASRRARREGGGGGGGRHPRDDDASVAGDLKGACSDEEALARHAIHGAQA